MILLIKKYLEIIVNYITNTQFNQKLANAYVNLIKKEDNLRARLSKKNLSEEVHEEINSKLSNVNQAKIAIMSFLNKQRPENKPTETRIAQLNALKAELHEADIKTQTVVSKQPETSFIAELKIIFSGTARLLNSVFNAIEFELKREQRKERQKPITIEEQHYHRPK